MITSYNQTAWGDTLIAVLAPDQADEVVKSAEHITGIYDQQGQPLGFNFFQVSDIVSVSGQGQVTLDADARRQLNAAITAAGLPGALPLEDTPKFVIGKIIDFKAHPKSDHLHITKVDFGTHQEQIVCGAPNAALGETVVAALPGAMMPDGKIIWPGELMGVESDGMLSSAKELGIPGASNKRGILLMPDSIPAGTPFDFKKAEAVVAAQA